MAAEVLPFLAKAKSQLQAKAICLWLLAGADDAIPDGVDDDAYLRNVKRMLATGILSATLEKRIWEYAFGRPMDVAESDDQGNPVERLTDEELARELEASSAALRAKMNRARSRAK
jgi:hypothetical protein